MDLLDHNGGEIFAVNESVGRMADFKHANVPVPRFIHNTPTRSSYLHFTVFRGAPLAGLMLVVM